MSTRPPNNGSGPLDHLSMRYLRQVLNMAHPSDEPYVLNPVESRVIRRTKIITLTIAALLGVMGVLLLYWPQYNWPELFSTTTVRFLGNAYELPLITILYSLLLIYLDVNLLLAINLWGVKSIMEICQFPRAHDAQYEQHLQSLAKATLAKSQRISVRFGIDSYMNLPRWGLTFFFLLTTAKAALSTTMATFFLKQSLTVRSLTDFMGMPIYAFWNMWASWQTLHEAQVRVMAPITIREFVHELHEEWGQNDQFRLLILEALHYVSILDRQHNYAHFMLTETLVDRFNLPADRPLTGGFVDQALQVPVGIRQSLERLIVFGVLVDGKLSWFEKSRLRELRKKGVLTYSSTAIQRISTDYNQGKGLWV